jgi:glycerol kinase
MAAGLGAAHRAWRHQRGSGIAALITWAAARASGNIRKINQRKMAARKAKSRK